MQINLCKFVINIIILLPCCATGKVIRDVDFPATPVDMTKVKKGKACYKTTMVNASGNGSIIEAAKNGGITTVYIVEYGEEYEAGGFVQNQCTYVYGS